ncbi:hypothetical protein A5886_000481 [Enterococcus sp. 8G7_MSG3316]|uniref:Integral membrane protein n=1 Tax=Candidatus Enterococcus testudinis TaxID=1834191 RepID=A0A242A3V4_9ENTE|nr:DUF975 family protein [Enterococcus sp. 8G7_MSG3316]OTN75411.1 hypothetical protein A5886_000481 [Enterococcus sp. 8G7_MSG3316]
MKTIGELKREAKQMLSGRWKDSVLMCLVPTLIAIAITAVLFVVAFLPVMHLLQSNGPMDQTALDQVSSSGNGGGGLINGLFAALFGAGISWTFLDILRGKRTEIKPFSDVFRGFQGTVVLGIIVIFILTTIFTTLWTLLFIIPGIVKAYAYSQAYFVYYDTYEQTGMRPDFLSCITGSRHLMKGYKGKLFLLDLSFIGWHILAIMTAGIGYLWLTPYISATKAAFYENLPKQTFA